MEIHVFLSMNFQTFKSSISVNKILKFQSINYVEHHTELEQNEVKIIKNIVKQHKF